jgi:hypothetical protein
MEKEFGSGVGFISRGMDTGIRIRIRTKMSRIPNTGQNTAKRISSITGGREQKRRAIPSFKDIKIISLWLSVCQLIEADLSCARL